jgi:hypothetical protein
VTRRLLNLLTLLTLLLCVAVAALWVRSYYVGDWISGRTSVAEQGAGHDGAGLHAVPPREACGGAESGVCPEPGSRVDDTALRCRRFKPEQARRDAWT